MTQRTLPHSLRPRKFSQLIGQSKVTHAIVQQYKNKREPSAWMFTGPTGTGKTTLARILSLSLQCTHGTMGEPCEDCWKARASFQIQEVNASEVSGVDEIGSLVQGSVYLPAPPSRRNIYILDEAQRLSQAAQNLLLKYFEDTPTTTVWMVCTTEPHKILETLKGRCETVKLLPLDVDQIEKLVARALKALGSKKEVKPLVESLCEAQVQYPRHILNAVEKYLAGMEPKDAVENLVLSVDASSVCRAMAAGDWNKIRAQTEKCTPDDLRGIRAKVAGYLRGMLEERVPGPRAKELARAIEMIAKVDSYTDVTQGPATVGVLYDLSQLFADPEKDQDDA